MAPVGTLSVYITVLILIIVTQATSRPNGRSTKSTSPYLDSSFTFTNLTARNGYKSEEHSVVTKDGYILGLYRIVHGKNCHKKKRLPPVLLMHGLLESSDAWIDAGPKAGLAYLISDACFDIWVGNCRGNYYSRRHVTLDPDKDAKFWHFSVDEIGLYDVPAMIDYVLKNTEVKKLNYIGYSQGAGSFFIMCSERPEYCDKINIMISLAPASRQLNTRSPAFRLSTITFAAMERLLRSSGVEEVLRQGAPAQQLLATFCKFPLIVDFCNIGIGGVVDFIHPGSVSNETVKMAFNHFPAGTSLHNMARYGQSMLNPEFVKFDYGKERNLKLYGSEKPPKYNLGAVSTPVAIIYGRNDGLVDVRDVKWLAKQLPNVIDVMEVKDPLWNHMDVNFSQYVRKLIFPKIHEHLLANSY